MNIENAAKRTYQMTARADAAEETHERIMHAAKQAFSHALFDEVTLTVIAEEAGVTVQTVIRRFGSKERLLESVAEREIDRVKSERMVSAKKQGDLASAVRVLVTHYEVDGKTMLNLLAQEARSSAVAKVLSNGRGLHEAWVRDNCAEVLAGGGPETLAAAIAATDLYVWKLLRIDRGMSQRSVERTMLALLQGLVKTETRE